MTRFNVLAAVCSLLATAATALDPISVQQQQFIQKSGERFMMIGVDYQPGGEGGYGTGAGDPLSNSTICLRDAALMQRLGINTIRMYNLDPTLNHDECASIFNAIGIYMVVDVNAPLAGESLDRSQPEASYTTSYLTRIFSIVEAFKDYPNILGFFAGNEIINDIPTAGPTPPYIRAVQRDLKNYIAAHASRKIPVGYSAAQVQEVLHDTWAYLECDNDGDNSRSDFFGLNSYSWCGDASSFTISKYNVLADWFNNSTIPVFFSEFGCNTPSPRLFQEIPTLYGPQMVTLSGGLVYEWTQSQADYGLVQTEEDGSLKLLADFDRLQEQYNKLNITQITTQNDTATNLKPRKCSKILISNDGFSSNFDIPEPPSGADALIKNGIKNPPKGKIVEVRDTAVTVKVYKSDGSEVENLEITIQEGANSPGKNGDGLETASATSTSTDGPKPSATKKGGAGVVRAVGGGFGAAAAALVLALLM
ncbi:uncharacterized protein MYCGRDRAFT_75460 [Zymoseptoria tritici IPO323]|uniref:1,3-beta-glucanosyltransferase n=1 Tax=Zymoseptoria tritici (strain CBS 115943 / IPO323) TaxID=336722 RepID=F9XJW6_ZYMTI|nr:uncharacterized protein MYCGRDRAFT_75460 [Zymoseptoria tritici IPO323]EGP84342.1 hypothetical protein MYCGRDRAFT_75460 [Zymoseptoria tritici IPO323]